ncbi:MAG: F0F1 ATP synthase subunit A [Ignavibacteriales bacterium]|nr:F0F1 ATP synthase subunit A [Ignavibacteriales bacterium]
MFQNPEHTTAIADTLKTAAEHGKEKESLFAELLHHTQDSKELELPFLGHVHLPHFEPFQFLGMTFDMSMSKHVVFLILSAVLLIIFGMLAARSNTRKKVPSGFGNLMEVFVVFIRDEIVIPNMGKGGVKYLPYLITTFFFILTMNLFGMIPYGASATGNVNVTAGLAIIAFIMIQFSSIRSQGFGHYLAHLTGGVHWALWPIMIPIEILGLFTKPFALCIRLFANMTGGHIVIVALIGLVFIFKSWVIAPVPIAFVLGINFLELFVAFLQAYIFVMLTSLFMGLGMVSEHAHNEEHGH